MRKITIIGSGSWGVALAIHLAKLGHKIKMWSFSKEEADLINNEKKCKFLPKVTLPEEIECCLDYKEAIEGSEIILHVTPSKFTRSTVSEYKKYVTNQPIIICSKGFERETLLPLDEVIKQEMPEAKIGVLSGPSHAEEVGRKLPTTCVIGAKTKKTAEYLQSAFINKVFRVYTSPDILGIELGGSLKNVIALAAGIADGLGYGDNTKAALITRGIAEIARLGVKMGGKIETFTGLTGIGDLIVTCASVHSRNRKAGYLIGQGRSMQEAMDEVQMVVEGVYSAKAAAKLAKKYDVPMPIVEEVNKVLFEGKSPAEAVDDLMLRESRSEHRALQWEK